MKRLVALIEDRPLLALAVMLAVVVTGGLAWVLRTAAMKRAVRKTFYLCRNTAAADVGWRDLLYWLAVGTFIALPIALIKGYGKDGDSRFHWAEFWTILAIVALSNAAKVVFEGLSAGKRILRPVHGGVWRQDRKIKAAAILKKVNVLATKGRPTGAVVRDLLTDCLDVIASHVRDHRGRHKSIDVFANLLLVQGGDLVVVARDSNLHNKDYQRQVPSRHPRAALAVSRAIESRRVIAVGDYHLEYPESPKNKPYRAILGLPLISSDDKQAIGVVSIDAAMPYFFETFTPGSLEDDLENSLAPYLHMMLQVLEILLTRDSEKMVELLTEVVLGNEGGNP